MGIKNHCPQCGKNPCCCSIENNPTNMNTFNPTINVNPIINIPPTPVNEEQGLLNVVNPRNVGGTPVRT